MKIHGDIKEVKKGFDILADKSVKADIEVRKMKRGSIEVEGKDGKYTIKYKILPEFFRALSIMTYQIKSGKKNFKITEKRKFDTCGIMADMSRNAVLKVESVKRLLRYMAKMGLNMLMLYTEDTYKMEKYPYFGYFRGAYEKEELKEIVSYAEKLGVEVIPCIQTLGHLGRTLRWPYAWRIKDNNEVLLIDEEKTYEFIEEMFKTCRECFKTNKIHVGMDEAHGVGLGNYLTKHGLHDRFELLSRHLGRVSALAEKYGFEPMMWSDMFMRLGSQSGGYYDLNAKLPKNISSLIPEKMSMVYWDYYNLSEDVCDGMIKIHKKMGKPIVFAGGIWTWTGFQVNYEKTFATTEVGLNACVKHGVKDVFATMWGDDGAECSIFEGLLGLQLYAEYNYSDDRSDKHLKEMFKICTGLDMDAFLLLSIDTFNDSRCRERNATISKQVYYQLIMEGLFDKHHALLDLKTHYKKYLDKLKKLPPQGEFEYLFEEARLYTQVVYEKCNSGNRLVEAYKANDRKELAKLAKEFDHLSESYKKHHDKVAEIWYMNNKPFGFEVIDERLFAHEGLSKRAAQRIRDYLDGKVEKLEELEEPRLWFAGMGNPFIHNYFTSMIMTI